MSLSSSNSLKLSEQRWYQNSTSNMSMYMSNNNNVSSQMGSPDVATNYGTIPTTGTMTSTGDKNPVYLKSSHLNSSAVERFLPDLLVMELRRDMTNAVTYRHYTIRGLYRYVLDSISDRTGILQAAACYQLWQKKSLLGTHSESPDGGVNQNPPTTTSSGPTDSTGTNDSKTENTPISDNGDLDNHQNTTTAVVTAATNPTSENDGTSADTVEPLNSFTPTNTAEHQSVLPSSDHLPIIDSRPPPPLESSNTQQPPDRAGVPAAPVTRKTHGQSAKTNVGSNVTYRERLGGYLHPRDMRRLVTPFSTSNEPEIIVRRHVILINYDPLRTIILRDRILVLVPNGADSLLSKLESRVRGNSTREDMENAIFGTLSDHSNGNSMHDMQTTAASTTASTVSAKNSKSRTDRGFLSKKSTSNISADQNNVDGETKTTSTDRSGDDDGNDEDGGEMTAMDEWHEMAAREWVNLPFELQCTDAVLNVVGSILQEETIEVQNAAQIFIEQIVRHGGAGLQDDPLTIIRVVKDAVQLMSNRVKSYIQSIQRLLDDDEDMALMNLSRLLSHPERFVQPVPQRILNEESDEPELILEGNLQIGLTLVNYLDVIQGQIHTAKELIDQRLDATRNKLLFANMLISVFTLCVTLGALVGSFFGMNLELPNNLAEDDLAFNQVVVYTCIGCFVICVLIMVALLYTDTIPFSLSRPFRPVRINV